MAVLVLIVADDPVKVVELPIRVTVKEVPILAHPEVGVPVTEEAEGAVKIPPERAGAVVKELIVAEFPA